MWKLLASVLAVSDAGSISTSLVAIDFDSKASCQIASELYSGSTTKTISVGGKSVQIVIRSSSTCIYNMQDAPGSIPMRRTELPPPIAGALNGFLRGMQQ